MFIIKVSYHFSPDKKMSKVKFRHYKFAEAGKAARKVRLARHIYVETPEILVFSHWIAGRFVPNLGHRGNRLPTFKGWQPVTPVITPNS